ncbi:MAG: ABC transporter ATP-binding protein [Granulosicoccus sp.]
MITASNLWKQYGNNTVLERVSVSVKEGEFVTLVGASGCGKTTFLKLLLGVEAVSQGALTLDNKPIPAEPGPDRGIVFQQYSVFSHMTVLGNVVAAISFQKSNLTGILSGREKERARHRCLEMLERVGLAESAAKYPHELSGGMRQRLAIAQALLAEPRILLLDEPFGALDPGIRADMHDLVLSLWKEHKLTIFMVTHDLKEGFQLGTRLWVFDRPRHDPQAPEAYGATITYDLPLNDSARPESVDLQNTPAINPSASAAVPVAPTKLSPTKGPR